MFILLHGRCQTMSTDVWMAPPCIPYQTKLGNAVAVIPNKIDTRPKAFHLFTPVPWPLKHSTWWMLLECRWLSGYPTFRGIFAITIPSSRVVVSTVRCSQSRPRSSASTFVPILLYCTGQPRWLIETGWGLIGRLHGPVYKQTPISLAHARAVDALTREIS